MSYVGETPFVPQPSSFAYLNGRLEALGLAPGTCRVGGTRALYLQGYVEFPGRADLFVSDQSFDDLTDRMIVDEAFSFEAESNDVETNELLVYYPQEDDKITIRYIS